MNFGPLEFSEYLSRKDAKKKESAAVKAARDAAPIHVPEQNQLSIVSGPPRVSRRSRADQVVAVSVYEAVAMRAPCAPRKHGPVRVRILHTPRPVVLVLSSHQTVEWELDVAE